MKVSATAPFAGHALTFDGHHLSWYNDLTCGSVDVQFSSIEVLKHEGAAEKSFLKRNGLLNLQVIFLTLEAVILLLHQNNYNRAWNVDTWILITFAFE
eukprot:gene6354-9735_t